MPRLTLRVSGMALFARHQDDSRVEIKFITQELEGHLAAHSHHDPPQVHQHVPLLVIAADAWAGVSPALAGDAPTRAPGRPIYLAAYDNCRFHRNGQPLPGPVRVSDRGPVTTQPENDDEWDNFSHLIVTLPELFPAHSYSPELAQRVAPFGTMVLTGGRLSTERPIMPAAEGPWDVIDRSEQERARRWLTDVVTYSFDFATSDTVHLALDNQVSGTDVVALKTTGDINAWLVHQPFLASLSRKKAKEIQHTHIMGSVVLPEPDPAKLPPTIRQPDEAPLLHPDDQSCPPFQVTL